MEELEPPQLADLPEEAESPREEPPEEPEEPPVAVVKAKAKARAKAKPAPAPEPPPPPSPAPEPPKPKARAKAKAKAKAAPAPPAPTPEVMPEATPEPTFPTFKDPVALLAAALHSAREKESQRRLQLYETFVFGKR